MGCALILHVQTEAAADQITMKTDHSSGFVNWSRFALEHRQMCRFPLRLEFVQNRVDSAMFLLRFRAWETYTYRLASKLGFGTPLAKFPADSVVSGR